MGHGHHHGGSDCAESHRHQRLAMNISLAVAILMLVGKLFAYFITGSTGILSDSAESIVHIVATGMAAFSLWFAQRPADELYLYGYGKIAFFSIGLEGGLIFAAALFIIVKSVSALVYGVELQELGTGIAITGALGFLNLLLGTYLVSLGKREGAPVLIANGKHILTDMVTSFAVVVGVTVVWFTGITWLDPAIGLVAAAQIIGTGSTLLKESFEQAMDKASVQDTRSLTAALDSLVSERVISGYHQLRHRKVNDVRWIELHTLVPGSLTVADAHSRVTTAEKRLQELFPKERVFITSHVEPSQHELAHPEGHGKDPLLGAIS